MNLLDNLAKYIPIGSVLIIFLSYLRQFLFYNQFNIDITNFISLPVFFVLFLKDSILIIAILIITLPLVLMIKNLKSVINRILKMENRKKWSILILGTVIMGIVYFLTIRDIVLESKKPDSDFSLIVVLFSAFSLILSYSIIAIILKKKISLKFQLISGFFFAVIFTSSLALLRSYQIKTDSINVEYKIIQENKTITTDNNLVRIGQTENYLFLFNRENQTSSVIKTKNIKEIYITRKN